jgi:iron(II)-dependent oxidoreductase
MVRSYRWALLLRPALAKDLDASQLQPAIEAFEESTSLLPAGSVLLDRWWFDQDESDSVSLPRDRVEVDSVFIDRFAVTNHQYQAFVDQGGYQQQSLWQASVWPRVVEYVDSTGLPGPRFWSDGHHPEPRRDHPVVGVSWFEADAYARWIGKRLPTDSEWVKAACWPIDTEGESLQRKYPWGDAFDLDRANLWNSGLGGTAAVGEFPRGDSVGGVRQMVGNVWEWTGENVQLWDQRGELQVEHPLKSLRGGAFDAYFETQASCQLQSGDSPLARQHNIGFRCSVSVCDLIPDVADTTNSNPPTAQME